MLSTFLHPNKNHRRTAARTAVIALIFVATALFPAHPSRAVSFVMTPDPVVFSEPIDDGVSIVGAVEISWSLLAVDAVLAKYTYRVEGTITGLLLPNSIPHDDDFLYQFFIVQHPSVCCALTPQFANVSNAIVSGGGQDLRWFMGFEPLAPTFSFEMSQSIISQGFDPQFPPGTPVLLTGQSISFDCFLNTPETPGGTCGQGGQDVTFTAIPEPSTMMLLFGSGLAALGLWRYRKSRKA